MFAPVVEITPGELVRGRFPSAQAAAQALADLAVGDARRGVPPLDWAEIEFVADQPGLDLWEAPESVAERGAGDCEGLVRARLAELLARGETGGAELVPTSDPRQYHFRLRQGQRVWDPASLRRASTGGVLDLLRRGASAAQQVARTVAPYAPLAAAVYPPAAAAIPLLSAVAALPPQTPPQTPSLPPQTPPQTPYLPPQIPYLPPQIPYLPPQMLPSQIPPQPPSGQLESLVRALLALPQLRGLLGVPA